jgi:MFS family permease
MTDAFAAPRSDRLWLLGLCLARAGASTMSMAYPTVLSAVQSEWALSATAAGSINAATQLGTALSLVVLSALADHLGPRIIFVGSATAAAVSAFLIPSLAGGYLSGLILFFVAAVAVAGTYTPGVMLIASRFEAGRRGGAVGWFLASSSVGYVLTLLLGGLVVARSGWRAALFVLALGPLCCLVLALLMFRGSSERPPPAAGGLRFDADLSGNRPAQLMIAGYIFHSWELLGMWAWTPAFMAAVLAGQGIAAERSAGLGASLSAVFHVMGIVASSAGGWLSDRWGRTAVISGMLVVSSACSFSFGWMLTAPIALVLIVGSVYGFSALGDSPVLSTGLTETVSPARLGSALAIRSLLGFGVGAIAPVVFGRVLDLHGGVGTSASGWGWAFSALGLGGVLGLACMFWLRALPESRRLAGGKR